MNRHKLLVASAGVLLASGCSGRNDAPFTGDDGVNVVQPSKDATGGTALGTGGMSTPVGGPAPVSPSSDPLQRCREAVLAGPTVQLPGAGEDLSGIVALTSSTRFAGPVTVAPGTVFLVNMGDTATFTSGVDPIVMAGTPEAPITFCGKNSEQGPGLWQGLIVEGGPGTQLHNVAIVGAGAEGHAAFEATENALVTNLTVTHSASDAVLSRSGFAEGTDSFHVDNVAGAPLRIVDEDGLRNLPRTITASAVSTEVAVIDFARIERSSLTIAALDIPYMLPGRKFGLGASPTIEPGTRFVMQPAGSISLSGSQNIFNVVGTADAPIVFEPLDTASPGSWYGLSVNGAHEESRLSNVIIRGAGREDSFALDTDAKFIIEDVTIEDSVNGARFRSRLREGSRGLNVRGVQHVVATIDFSDIDAFPAGGKLSDNDSPMVHVDPGIFESGNNPKTIKRLDVPYFLTASSAYNWWADSVVQPGTEFVMEEGTQIDVDGGSLQFVGTASAKIVFRGERDEPGLWGGIYLSRAEPSTRFEHVKIRNAGSRGYSMRFWNVEANVEACSFENGLGHGISGYFSAEEIVALEDANTFTDIELQPVHDRL